MHKNKEIRSKLLSDGYAIFAVEDMNTLDELRQVVCSSLDIGPDTSLDMSHSRISIDEINERRIGAFRELNKIPGWEQKYFSLAKSICVDLLGPDISIQSKLNLSIQLPDDMTSTLGLHTDALSGQSVFEIVLWVPLTNAYGSNSMYIYPRNISYEMLSKMREYERDGMDALFEKYKSFARFLKVDYGSALIFSPTMFHGNVVNRTHKSRVSINCRFKNLFSPESETGERRLGSFYRLLTVSEITRLGLSYRDENISFDD